MGSFVFEYNPLADEVESVLSDLTCLGFNRSAIAFLKNSGNKGRGGLAPTYIRGKSEAYLRPLLSELKLIRKLILDVTPPPGVGWSNAEIVVDGNTLTFKDFVAAFNQVTRLEGQKDAALPDVSIDFKNSRLCVRSRARSYSVMPWLFGLWDHFRAHLKVTQLKVVAVIVIAGALLPLLTPGSTTTTNLRSDRSLAHYSSASMGEVKRVEEPTVSVIKARPVQDKSRLKQRANTTNTLTLKLHTAAAGSKLRRFHYQSLEDQVAPLPGGPLFGVGDPISGKILLPLGHENRVAVVHGHKVFGTPLEIKSHNMTKPYGLAITRDGRTLAAAFMCGFAKTQAGVATYEIKRDSQHQPEHLKPLRKNVFARGACANPQFIQYSHDESSLWLSCQGNGQVLCFNSADLSLRHKIDLKDHGTAKPTALEVLRNALVIGTECLDDGQGLRSKLLVFDLHTKPKSRRELPLLSAFDIDSAGKVIGTIKSRQGTYLFVPTTNLRAEGRQKSDRHSSGAFVEVFSIQEGSVQRLNGLSLGGGDSEICEGVKLQPLASNCWLMAVSSRKMRSENDGVHQDGLLRVFECHVQGKQIRWSDQAVACFSTAVAPRHMSMTVDGQTVVIKVVDEHRNVTTVRALDAQNRWGFNVVKPGGAVFTHRLKFSPR